MISRRSSGSKRTDRAVEPTRSQNMMVNSRRSPSIAKTSNLFAFLAVVIGAHRLCITRAEDPQHNPRQPPERHQPTGVHECAERCRVSHAVASRHRYRAALSSKNSAGCGGGRARARRADARAQKSRRGSPPTVPSPRHRNRWTVSEHSAARTDKGRSGVSVWSLVSRVKRS
jgi:hypothetical protein